MTKNKLLLQVSIIIVFILLIGIKFLNKEVIVLNCAEISDVKKIQKQLSKPYLRTIDIVEMELGKKTVHIQSNDKVLIQDIFKEIENCKKNVSIKYFDKESLDNIETYFVGNFFF